MLPTILARDEAFRCGTRPVLRMKLWSSKALRREGTGYECSRHAATLLPSAPAILICSVSCWRSVQEARRLLSRLRCGTTRRRSAAKSTASLLRSSRGQGQADLQAADLAGEAAGQAV